MTTSNSLRLPRRQWVDMTTTEFARLPPETIAVLPVAAVEQHGPHLPVYVDACLNAGIVERAAAMLPEDLPVTFLPMQPVGKSNEHLAFPGTLSLSMDTIVGLWTDIAESVARAGVRKLVILNSHGGQPQVAQIVAREMRVRRRMLVVCANSFDLGMPEGAFSAEELRHGIHGGAYETSMMLALRPDLVQMEKAEDFVPLSVLMARDFRFLSPEGTAQFGWQTQDLHASGACGNALEADEAHGRDCLAMQAEALVALLGEVHRFRPPFFEAA